MVCAIIKISAQKFGYNDALTSDNLKNLMLRLPAQKNADGSLYIDEKKEFSDEGFVPDWEGMEEHMEKIKEIAEAKIQSLT